ncbi:14374_t:CDS:2 [Ambispora leptoticha]|uniref:Transcription initiation factor IIF subunit alpha n=1 Tax=Ambispora leptoticha TaxID=144679 RepID=A0A9N9BBQ3_9GLOM|nr:14374_t:CDS:2 [Ambispora leptoticha]
MSYPYNNSTGAPDFHLKSSTISKEFKVNLMRFPKPVDLNKFTPPVKLYRGDPNAPHPSQVTTAPANNNATNSSSGGAAASSNSNQGKNNSTTGADTSKIAPYGGATRNKQMLFKKRTKQIYLASKESRKLKQEEDKPWILTDYDDQNSWIGEMEGGIRENQYAIFLLTEDGFKVVPVNRWYKFKPKIKHRTLSLEEAEEAMTKAKKKDASRWMMHTFKPSEEDEKIIAEEGLYDPKAHLQQAMDEEEKEADIKVKKSIRKATIKREEEEDNNLPDSEVDDDLTSAGKDLKRIVRQHDSNEAYISDKDEDPYASSTEEEDATAETKEDGEDKNQSNQSTSTTAAKTTTASKGSNAPKTQKTPATSSAKKPKTTPKATSAKAGTSSSDITAKKRAAQSSKASQGQGAKAVGAEPSTKKVKTSSPNRAAPATSSTTRDLTSTGTPAKTTKATTLKSASFPAIGTPNLPTRPIANPKVASGASTSIASNPSTSTSKTAIIKLKQRPQASPSDDATAKVGQKKISDQAGSAKKAKQVVSQTSVDNYAAPLKRNIGEMSSTPITNDKSKKIKTTPTSKSVSLATTASTTTQRKTTAASTISNSQSPITNPITETEVIRVIRTGGMTTKDLIENFKPKIKADARNREILLNLVRKVSVIDKEAKQTNILKLKPTKPHDQ